MSGNPRVVAVADGSPACRAGICADDEILTINGVAPTDIIAYQQLVDEPDLEFRIKRKGLTLRRHVTRDLAEPLGLEIHSAVFDRIRTCDNHCSFCFIYQLPKGMRRSLYVKDDDYRLSFLYGNFTTLTRFTEADLERVITEKLSPLYVSLHTTDPELRAKMLRNPRGATSLRWLRMLLDHGVTVHGQVVVCPGINNGDVLDDTLAGVLDEYPELASVAVVPLGVSRFTSEPDMRPHRPDEAARDIAIVEEWQNIFLTTLGHRTVFAADEYYLIAKRPFPEASHYEGFAMYEDGIGMARAFEEELLGHSAEGIGAHAGFFQSLDAPALGYRAPRAAHTDTQTTNSLTILTGAYGAAVMQPHQSFMRSLAQCEVEIVPVQNHFFGGNIGVTGLLTGTDIREVIAKRSAPTQYVLPDVCLSGGKFLDDLTPEDLGASVDIIGSDGVALRKYLEDRNAS